jgi:phage terminase small subunit
MAGVKGRSGGARPNTGGARPGAGRKPAETVKLTIPVPIMDTLAHKDPMVFLMALMNDIEADIKLRADAAKTLMMYTHLKKGDGGVKDEKAEKAKKAGQGKFAAAPAPLRMIK